MSKPVHKSTNRRLEDFRQKLDELGLSAALISRPANIFYLSGFSGTDACLYVDLDKAYLVSDFRYAEQAKKELKEVCFCLREGPMAEALAACLDRSVSRLGFEAADSHSFFTSLKKAFPSRLAFWPIDQILAKARRVKDEEEIEAIAQAARMADQAFLELAGKIGPGVTEKELAAHLEFFMRRSGADRTSFDTILASGPRSSLPHGLASDKIISDNELLLIDFGCQYGGYCSDMTRTVSSGRPSDQERAIYQIVHQAQEKALEGVRAGVAVSHLDSLARGVIDKAGYGDYFGHALGHGVGLEVHEAPSLSQGDTSILEENMVITIEPGIYLPQAFGVRIEDLIRVKADGFEFLSRAKKSLIIP